MPLSHLLEIRARMNTLRFRSSIISEGFFNYPLVATSNFVVREVARASCYTGNNACHSNNVAGQVVVKSFTLVYLAIVIKLPSKNHAVKSPHLSMLSCIIFFSLLQELFQDYKTFPMCLALPSRPTLHFRNLNY